MNRKIKKKTKLKILMGVVHVHCSFYITLITITDLSGNTISWASAGVEGFKGARKATPFAAQRATTKAALLAMDQGLKRVEVIFRGQGSARETAVRAIQGVGLEVMSIKDLTPIPYNGCRAPKPRRI